MHTGPLNQPTSAHCRPPARPIHNSAPRLPLVSIPTFTLWLSLNPPLVALAHQASAITRLNRSRKRESRRPVNASAAGWEKARRNDRHAAPRARKITRAERPSEVASKRRGLPSAGLVLSSLVDQESATGEEKTFSWYRSP